MGLGRFIKKFVLCLSMVTITVQNKALEIIESPKPLIEKIITLSFLVRDIPYALIGSFDPEIMLKIGKGSCTPKHVLLSQYFGKLGVCFRFVMVPFYWKDMHLSYPQEKQVLIDNMPLAYHTALQINMNNKWVLVDITWDKALHDFPVNDQWGGTSDMELAVVPAGEFEITKDPIAFKKEKKRTSEQHNKEPCYVFLNQFIAEKRNI